MIRFRIKNYKDVNIELPLPEGRGMLDYFNICSKKNLSKERFSIKQIT